MEWKPLGEYMIVEKYQESLSGVILPEDLKPGEGDTFKVIEVGEGWYTDSGKRVSFNILPGDRVMIAGKILRIPGEKTKTIARQGDVLALQRDDMINLKIKEIEENDPRRSSESDRNFS